MTLVLDQKSGPGVAGTHALVIGVGEYPFLDAGAAGLSDIVRGLRSLASPAASARTFASWLATEYRNPGAPIATIDVLVSDAAGQGYMIEGVERGPLEVPDVDSVISASLAWKARGDADPNGVMIFYFCGHGMTAGLKNALLARDVGKQPQRPMRSAFDPDKLLAGMKTCAAAKQLYLFDACRSANEELFRDANEQPDGLIPAGAASNPAVSQAAFYSTRHGAPAYGVTSGGVSVFTGILLKALNGLAANERDGPWRINTHDLAKALEHAFWIVVRSRKW